MRLFITILSVFFCINCHAITEQTKSFAHLEYTNELTTLIDNNEFEKYEFMLKAFIESGAKDWQAIYALMLISGKGGRKNASLGMKLLTDAAQKGHYHAQKHLPEIYELGKGGIPQDTEKALYWYEMANSQKDISRIYAEGDLVKKSIEMAVEYLIRFNNHDIWNSKEDSQEIFYHLRKIHDSIKSKFEKGTPLNSSEYYVAGIFYRYGFEGFKKNIHTYKNYIAKSAQEGNLFAINTLGMQLCESESPEDKHKGLQLLEQAARSKQARFMHDYGITIATSGCGSTKAPKASEPWLLASIEKGYSRTMEKFFILYEFEDQKLTEKLTLIAKQYKHMTLIKGGAEIVNFSALAEALENGKYKNDPFIKYFLGVLYKEYQPEKAKKLLTNAFNHGHIKAIAELQKMGNECQSSFDINGITMNLEIVISDYIVDTSDCNNFIKDIKESLQKHSSVVAIKAKRINLISIHEANILPCIYKYEQECPSYSKIRKVSKKISISVNNRKNLIPGFSRAGKTIKHIDMETVYISWSEVESQEKRIINEVLNLLH